MLSEQLARQMASQRRPVRRLLKRRNPLVVVFAAVPLLEELVKEVRVSLSLGVGLIAGVDLGNQGIVLGVFS